MQQSMNVGNFMEYHLLLGKIYAGSGKHGNMKNHADDMQMRQTDKSQWMMSQMCKTMSQIIHTNQSHKSIAQDGMASQPRMENNG